MRILVVVAQESEVAPMKRLLARAGVQADVWDVLTVFYEQNPDAKPPMKYIREVKLKFDSYVKGYDVLVAAGETAARLVLDTSTVNINKLRGRDFEYAYGVKTPGKKKVDEERPA